jgi:ribosomal protein S12
MRKGEKYQKKIVKSELIKLRRQRKTGKEIAKYFECSTNAVAATVKRYGLKYRTPNRLKKAVKSTLQTKIFREVNAHVTTAQGMINELSIAISDNVQIKESIKQKIKEAKRAYIVKEEIDRFFEAQDRVVQRMKDYRELQKDLIGIAELQKFIFAITEAYKTLPIEYRIIFQNELKKRDIVHLTVEQLVAPLESSEEHVESGDDRRGDRPLPATTTESNNITSPHG